MARSSPAPHFAAADGDVTHIRPRPGWHFVDLKELWKYRHLLGILAMRDIRVRYKQTVIGAAWAVLQPFTTMVIFTTLFRLVGRYPATDELPYAVTLFCALLPWQLFAHSLRESSESLVLNQRLITKVYFPRVIIPIAPTLAGLLDFAIGFGILMAIMAWYGLVPSLTFLAVPAFLILAVLTALAGGLWFSALNALYRDIRYVVPFLIQALMFLSPVVYETQSIIPEQYRLVYSLNPLAGVLEGFRWAILGKAAPPLASTLLSIAMVFVVFVTGMVFFRRVERTVADRV